MKPSLLLNSAVGITCSVIYFSTTRRIPDTGRLELRANSWASGTIRRIRIRFKIRSSRKLSWRWRLW